jgi:hypothetical protein
MALKVSAGQVIEQHVELRLEHIFPAGRQVMAKKKVPPTVPKSVQSVDCRSNQK